MRAILERLSMRTKMQLVALLALAAAGVPGALLVAEEWSAWRTVSSHLRGLEPAAALSQVMQHAQRHRGLANGQLNGNAGVAAEREAAAAAWQAAWPAAEAGVALLGDAPTAKAVSALKTQSQALAQAVKGGGVTAAESFALHTALVDRLVALQYDVAVASELVLHPEAAGYFLQDAVLRQLPPVMEGLARLRGSGMGLLSKKEASPVERAQVQVALAAARRQAQAVDQALRLAMRDRSELRAVLERPAQDAAAALADGLAYAEAQLVRAEALGEPPAQWWARLTTLIDQQYALSATARKQLEVDLDRYEATVKWRLIGAIAIVLSLLAGCLALVTAVARQVVGALQQAVTHAEAVASGDLTGRLQARGGDEIARMLRALDGMTQQLSGTVHAVRDNATQVATASSQIAQGNQDLSERTERQASSLQETAASIEQLGSTVTQTAQHAQEAHQFASRARDVAVRGGVVVGEVVQTLRDIGASSQRIADIIGTIDGLAFQTNILALNAAVEAARAGEQGRGFAVVAGEVRALAQRSASAAREIRDLIGASVDRMSRGTGQADQAADTMQEIVGAIERVAGLVGAISEASHEQSSGVRQAGEALSDIDHATQQNAALVEESAAAAESLRRQAQALREAVGAFHVLEGRGVVTAG